MTGNSANASAVIRALKKAHRAQEARPLMAAIVQPRPVAAGGHCELCGRPTKGERLCTGHDDLKELLEAM